MTRTALRTGTVPAHHSDTEEIDLPLEQQLELARYSEYKYRKKLGKLVQEIGEYQEYAREDAELRAEEHQIEVLALQEELEEVRAELAGTKTAYQAQKTETIGTNLP